MGKAGDVNERGGESAASFVFMSVFDHNVRQEWMGEVVDLNE